MNKQILDNKVKTMTNLFEGKEIRSVWDTEKEDYYFSVVDVISALIDNEYQKARNYWKWLKSKLQEEGSELVSVTNRLKMKAKDGKLRETDVLDTEGILRLIESVPSPNAEPFKVWLAKLGRQEIDNVFDPSKGIDKMIDYYLQKGYTLEWIESRIKAIINRKKLTNTWKENGIQKQHEYAILTNEIYQEWSGMKSSEYKIYKNIRKESLRDNMTDIEVALADLGEIATRELVKEHKPYGLKQNKETAKRGGKIAKITRDSLEKELGRTVITNKNALDYQYVDEIKKNTT